MYTAKIVTTAHRFEYIKASELKYTVLSTDVDGDVWLEITLDHSLDVLELFHAGINYGLRTMDWKNK